MNESRNEPKTDVPKVDVVVGILTATSAEFNGKGFSAFSNFVHSYQDAYTRACILRRGFSPKSVAYLAQTNHAGNITDNLDFPDVARLKRGLTGTSGDVRIDPNAAAKPNSGRTDFGTNPAIPKSQEASFNAALMTCETTGGPAELERLLRGGIAAKVMRAFGDLIQAMPSDPNVAKATTHLIDCMAKKGFEIKGPRDFFASIDLLTRSNADPAVFADRTARVKAYGSCVEPLSKSMDEFRVHARAQIEDKYAQELNDLQDQVDERVKALSELSSPYGS